MGGWSMFWIQSEADRWAVGEDGGGGGGGGGVYGRGSCLSTPAPSTCSSAQLDKSQPKTKWNKIGGSKHQPAQGHVRPRTEARREFSPESSRDST